MEAVVACGLQNAYFSQKGTMYAGEQSDVLKIRLEGYLKEHRARGNLIFAVREVHQEGDTFFRTGKSHSTVGSHDVQIPEAF
jgi:nicotinamidase-related amidase